MKEQLKKLIDKLWRISDDLKYEVILFRQEKPFENLDPGLDDDAINAAFIHDNKKYPHTEFIKKLQQPCIIEPDFSFAIAGVNKLVSETVSYPGLKPSVPRYLKSFFRPKKDYERAILFDGVSGRNYFHFFTEVINKVWLLQHIEGYRSLPFIIGEQLFQRKYFQYILHHTNLRELNWVVQKQGDYIKVEELYILKTMPFDAGHFRLLRDWLRVPYVPVRTRRVFINRPVKTGRFLQNMDEIKPILARYDFEVVDFDNTTLDYQMEVLASASHLLSIHGAGQANIVFADSSIRFTEILPGNRLSTHFYWLSMALGISAYNAIRGDDLPFTNVYPEKGFYISPDKVEQEIQRMLS